MSDNLPVDLDLHPAWRPPLGHWRVLDRDGWSGPFVRIIGDFAMFGEATDRLRLARHPYTRVVINDMGVEVMSITPGSDSAPDAGAES